MANSLALDLSPGEVTANGSSAAVDISLARSAAKLLARRLAKVGSGKVVLNLETSEDGATNWRSGGRFDLSGSFVELYGLKLSRFVRVSWDLGGLTSVTLSIVGSAETLYCEPSDVIRYALPEAALEEMPMASRLDACLAASDEAEGYLAAAYTMPLVAWSEDLRMQTGKMAVRYMLDRRGWDPEQGRNNVVEVGFDRAIAWLKRIAEGIVRPPGIIDSAPEVFEAGSVVVSRARRDRWA